MPLVPIEHNTNAELNLQSDGVSFSRSRRRA